MKKIKKYLKKTSNQRPLSSHTWRGFYSRSDGNAVQS